MRHETLQLQNQQGSTVPKGDKKKRSGFPAQHLSPPINRRSKARKNVKQANKVFSCPCSKTSDSQFPIQVKQHFYKKGKPSLIAQLAVKSVQNCAQVWRENKVTRHSGHTRLLHPGHCLFTDHTSSNRRFGQHRSMEMLKLRPRAEGSSSWLHLLVAHMTTTKILARNSHGEMTRIKSNADRVTCTLEACINFSLSGKYSSWIGDRCTSTPGLIFTLTTHSSHSLCQ